MLVNRLKSSFSVITHIRGKPANVSTNQVQLRGLHIKSTRQDSPNMIFIPEIFDTAENWLQFFMNRDHRILEERNVFVVYPRNFGNSDHCNSVSWEEQANDIARFMYEHRISMATMAGHGLGAKIALATGCLHPERTTGVFAIDSSPMNQYHHQAAQELRKYLSEISNVNLKRGYAAISDNLKQIISCPKWRALFNANLERSEEGYTWKFNLETIRRNLMANTPSSLWNWCSTNGLFTGKANFVFPEYSRYVHLSTNTLPMLNICPQVSDFNDGISYVQGDQNPQNHWVYELQDQINPYARRLQQFLRHHDGVNVLLKNRQEVGRTFVPERPGAKVERQKIPTEYQPAHYHHNWRFENVYNTSK